jgi:hypothetical protein
MSVLQRVEVGVRSIAAYRGTAPDESLDELIATAEPLRGARVLHISATPYGGGVSELLRSAVPLMRDLGLEVDWVLLLRARHLAVGLTEPQMAAVELLEPLVDPASGLRVHGDHYLTQRAQSTRRVARERRTHRPRQQRQPVEARASTGAPVADGVREEDGRRADPAAEQLFGRRTPFMFRWSSRPWGPCARGRPRLRVALTTFSRRRFLSSQ